MQLNSFVTQKVQRNAKKVVFTSKKCLRNWFIQVCKEKLLAAQPLLAECHYCEYCVGVSCFCVCVVSEMKLLKSDRWSSKLKKKDKKLYFQITKAFQSFK